MLWKLVLLGISVFLLPLTVFASSDCDDPSAQKFLKMDYKSFDQSPPDGGWRAFKDKGCDSDIAMLLDLYVKCRKGLTPDQIATLIFHSGQIYADLGDNEKALERFARSYNDKLNSKYHWNSFVDGTIAFIKKDAQKLRGARDKVQAAEKDHPYVLTLNNLIRCFGKPYKEVGPECVNPPPNPPPSAAGAVR